MEGPQYWSLPQCLALLTLMLDVCIEVLDGGLQHLGVSSPCKCLYRGSGPNSDQLLLQAETKSAVGMFHATVDFEIQRWKLSTEHTRPVVISIKSEVAPLWNAKMGFQMLSQCLNGFQQMLLDRCPQHGSNVVACEPRAHDSNLMATKRQANPSVLFLETETRAVIAIASVTSAY